MQTDNSNLDILVIAPHPDDAEMLCGGLLWKARAAGCRLGVADLTRGELGTRGTPAIRRKEAAAATRLLGLDARENLKLRDGHLLGDPRLLPALVRVLRKHRPKLVLAPHWEDQHPDHAAAGRAIEHAAYLAGVPKYEPGSARGVASSDALPYRPLQILHYNNRYGISADLVVDISAEFERKTALIGCYASQFGTPERVATGRKPAANFGPRTRLSHGNFFEWLSGMHSFYGHQIGVRFGEAYCVKGPLRADVVTLFELK